MRWDGLQDMQSPWSPHLGSALQLVHRWIICCLASGALGGTNELSQRLGHIFDSIYQNHLEKRTQREAPIYHNSAWESSFFNTSDIRRGVLITELIRGEKQDWLTCVSGSSAPMLAAPSLTTSVSWVMVLAEDWAAWDNLSWPEAAPDTSIFVSSTRALAVFKMFSLRGRREDVREGRDEGKGVGLIPAETKCKCVNSIIVQCTPHFSFHIKRIYRSKRVQTQG